MGLLLLSSGTASGCQDSGPGRAEEAVPEIRFAQVRFQVYREGRLAAAGDAASASYRRDTGDLSARTVEVSFPGEGVAPRLFAPRVRGNTRSRDVLAEGGLRMERGPEVAATEEARYDPDDRLVHGTWPIAIQGPGWKLEGPAFVLDPVTGRLQMGSGVRLEAREPVGGAVR